MDPYYIEGIIAGVKDNHPYLCCIDLYGNQYQDNYITTGIARMICPPIIDRVYSPDMSLEDAQAVLLKCFQALYARYSLADREVALCTVTEHEIREEKVLIDINYSYRGYIQKEDFM